MKYYLLLALAFLMSCQTTTTTENNKPEKLAQKVATVIHGRIANSNAPNILVESMGEQHTARINNNEFTINLMIDEPRIYTIRYSRRSGQIYVKPGDKIDFTTSANQFAQVMKFTGDGAIENNYLTDKVNNDRQAKSLKVKTYKLEEPEFITTVEADRQKNKSTFDEFCQNNTLDPFFKFIIDTEIEYEWANDRLIYPRYHALYAQKEDFEAIQVYFDFQRDLNMNDPGKMYAPNFNSFISNYADIEAGKVLEKDEKLKLAENGLALTKFNIIEEQFKNNEIKEFLMYNTLKTHIRYEGANGTTPLLATFDKVCQNNNLKRDIQNDYANWRGLEAGNPAPMFAYADINGQMHNMADYKGKYIYVDIWATWCGPCKKELPHLEALQEAYKDNDKILFTSVSIDRDKGAWERMVKNQDMKGLQLFAENEWRASIVQDYKINGIPRFLLIDDQGKIVSANAPRPSSPRIKAQLGNLVGEAM